MTSLVGVRRQQAAEARRGFVWPYPTPGMEAYGFAGTQYFGVATEGAGGVNSYESPISGYRELVYGPFKSNPIVFACELKRLSVFSEARFVWRGYNKGRPGKLFGSPELDILSKPWPRGATGDLLANMILSADIGGNAFVHRDVTKIGTTEDRLRVLRPDFVTIVMGDTSGRPVESAHQLDAEIIGFIYNPSDGQTEPEVLLADEVAHWVPIQDPLARFRGMSWLTPIIREAQADQAASLHKLMFFENGATPQLVVSFDKDVTEPEFRAFTTKMDQAHNGWRNAYKTLYVGGGATPTVVGKDLTQLDFSSTQGHGETRIAAASGIHPVLIPLSEGMQGSSLNAGNYDSARRSTADMTLRPLWRGACAALAPIIERATKADGSHAGPAELWYDEEFIPFLRDDSQKAADIEAIKAKTINEYVREGFTWESSIAAVQARDVGLLVHTGLFSVQLQELAVDANGQPTGVTGPPQGPPQGPPGSPTIPATTKPQPAAALPAGNGQGGKPK